MSRRRGKESNLASGHGQRSGNCALALQRQIRRSHVKENFGRRRMTDNGVYRLIRGLVISAA